MPSTQPSLPPMICPICNRNLTIDGPHEIPQIEGENIWPVERPGEEWHPIMYYAYCRRCWNKGWK